MTLMKSLCALSIFLFSCCLWPLQAAVIYVNQFASGNNTGLSWGDAYTDLHTALSTAKAGDEIWVAGGDYKPTNTNDRYATFSIPTGIAMYGGFAGTENTLEERDWTIYPTYLNGDIGIPGDHRDNSYTVVTIADPNENSILDGFDIRNGAANNEEIETPTYDAARRGGGLLIRTEGDADNYHMAIRNCRFINHVAEYGGAIYGDGRYNKNISMLAENCTFEGNLAIFGAVYSTDAGNTGVEGVQFINCTFRRNRAEVYGVIYIQAEGDKDGLLLLDGCLFEENENEIIDVYNFFSEVNFRIQINRSLIQYNEATDNNLPLIGYRPNEQSSLEMDSVTFLNNIGEPGIVDVDKMGDLILRHCHFESNKFGSLLLARPENFLLDSCRFIRNESMAMAVIGSETALINQLECIENEASTLMVISEHGVGAKTRIHNSRFVGNLAGSLLSVGGDSLLVSGLQILEDQGTNGNIGFGARYNRIVNSIFTRRDSTFSSIPIVISPAETALDFSNCTFYNYGATDSGLIFRFRRTEQHTNMLRISNSIIWDTLREEHPLFVMENAEVDIILSHSLLPNAVCDSSLLHELDYNQDSSIGNISCGNGMLLGLNPQFKRAAAGDLTLLACSPAIDAGENALFPGLPESDLAGQPRIVDDQIDLGAFETAADASVYDLTYEIIPASTEMAADGSIELLSVSGGTPEYHLSWSNGDSLSRIRQLLPGVYTLTITDQLGCSQDFSFEVNFTNAIVNPVEEWGTRLSPNPARRDQSGQLELSGKSDIRTLRLITPPGQVIWEQVWPVGQKQLPLRVPEGKGLYLVELTDGAGRRGYLKWMVQ